MKDADQHVDHPSLEATGDQARKGDKPSGAVADRVDSAEEAVTTEDQKEVKKWSHLVRGAAEYLASFALFILVGLFFELFVSASTRQQALHFQAQALAAISGLTPIGIIGIIIQAGHNSHIDTPSIYGVFPVAARTVVYVWRSDILAKIAFFPAIVISIVLGIGLFAARITDIEKPKWYEWHHVVLLPMVLSAASFLVALSLTSILFWVVQMIALLGLLLFGWLTHLAGLCAIGGSCTYIAAKAAEKAMGERAEHLVSRLIGGAAKQALTKVGAQGEPEPSQR